MATKVTLLGRARKGAKKAPKKACVFQSGPRRGRLKKGWRWAKGGRCVRAKK